MCCIEVITGISKKEIYEIIKEILNELQIRYSHSENRFDTEFGAIVVKDYGISRLNIKLHRVEFPDERLLNRFREKLMSKRAGG